jgi:AraC family transcriptional regulator of adaptative response/methylated-DNA-[protein]-cysteine methyltransferase
MTTVLPRTSPDGRAYATVAAAIRYLHRHAGEQPALAAVARHVGLSEFHLQRVFGDWAGISPKRFLQFLTKEHAKAALRASAGVLEASYAAGLSGPGRLHDLFVACEAVTPGEVRALGQRLVIDCGFAATPFGDALIGWTSRGVCHLRFADAGEQPALAELSSEWPHATMRHDDAHAARIAGRIFASIPAQHGAPLRVLLKGTNFQVQVWEALLRIPEGALATYGELARVLGRPEAARAVAGAVARNPVACLIPCHRVIRETGVLSGYRWGVERKAALLAHEAARRDPRPR